MQKIDQRKNQHRMNHRPNQKQTSKKGETENYKQKVESNIAGRKRCEDEGNFHVFYTKGELSFIRYMTIIEIIPYVCPSKINKVKTSTQIVWLV